MVNPEDDQPLRPASKDANEGLAKNCNKLLGLQDAEFEGFVDFDVAVCGELTDADILASV